MPKNKMAQISFNITISKYDQIVGERQKKSLSNQSITNHMTYVELQILFYKIIQYVKKEFYTSYCKIRTLSEIV